MKKKSIFTEEEKTKKRKGRKWKRYDFQKRRNSKELEGLSKEDCQKQIAELILFSMIDNMVDFLINANINEKQKASLLLTARCTKKYAYKVLKNKLIDKRTNNLRNMLGYEYDLKQALEGIAIVKRNISRFKK